MHSFQFTPLREGRHRLLKDNRIIDIFQFTPLREGRLKVARPGERARPHFNSRPSARGDVVQDNIVGVICISIHAPPRGATEFALSRPERREQFQFTPLREGRLMFLCVLAV